jgi:hypothetical protein
MAPFEMLYGRRCQTPLFWSETGERKVFGPDILQEAEKQVRMVRENLRVAQSRQKSYADHRRRELSFEVGDFVYLKVSPMRGLCHFKVRGKLAPRFIGPFKILEKRGELARQLELPSQLPIEDLDDKEDLSCQEYPVKILETSKRVMQTRRSRCARCNGVTTPRKRLLGKEKKS